MVQNSFAVHSSAKQRRNEKFNGPPAFFAGLNGSVCE